MLSLDYKTASDMNDRDLLLICSTNNFPICNDEAFWRIRFVKKFANVGNTWKPEEQTWKTHYLKTVIETEKLTLSSLGKIFTDDALYLISVLVDEFMTNMNDQNVREIVKQKLSFDSRLKEQVGRDVKRYQSRFSQMGEYPFLFSKVDNGFLNLADSFYASAVLSSLIKIMIEKIGKIEIRGSDLLLIVRKRPFSTIFKK